MIGDLEGLVHVMDVIEAGRSFTLPQKGRIRAKASSKADENSTAGHWHNIHHRQMHMFPMHDLVPASHYTSFSLPSPTCNICLDREKITRNPSKAPPFCEPKGADILLVARGSG
jgi:hypothetical protein